MAERACWVCLPLAPSTQSPARKCLNITSGQLCGCYSTALAYPSSAVKCYVPDAYLTGVHTVGCPRGRSKARGLAQYGVPHSTPSSCRLSASRLNSSMASLQSAARKPTCVLVVQARALVQWNWALAALREGENFIAWVMAHAAKGMYVVRGRKIICII